jgi:Skp family chaperone for outer membrane proteins
MLLTVLLLAVLSVFAQQPEVIATVDSRLFTTGILEYKTEIERLNKEFEKPTLELQALATELRVLEIDLATNRLNYTEVIRRERTELLEQMRKKYQRKSEDLESAIKKRAELVIEPLKEKIMSALKEFAQSRGITLVYDTAKAFDNGSLVYAAPTIDITRDFINNYNRTYR